MNKLIALGIMLLFLGMTISSSGFNSEKQSTVTTLNGNTLYVGGSGLGNYTKIQDAIDNASDGDTVFVYNGTYYEHLIINKSLKLKGENKCYTIISGGIYISDFVSVCDFTIQGNHNPGIVIHNSSFTQILNNRILNNTDGGIWFSTSDNCIIDDNSIFDNGGNGIYMATSPNNIIRNNRIRWNRECGIRCFFCDDLTIYNNTIGENFGSGIKCCDYNSINISDNDIWNNQGHGIRVGHALSNNGNISGNRIADNNRSGIYAMMFSFNISGNNISGNKNSGIYSFDTSGSTFTMNKIERNNECGIYLDGWKNNVSYNTISDNGDIGCYLNSSSDNKIICNTFIDNHRDAFFNIRNIRSDNIWDGNYWRRPRIFPKPILGIMNVLWFPIKIPWVNFDWHPAQEPYEIGV